MKPERLDERLRRLEQQVRAFKELHVAELQLILDEVADIKRELAEDATPVAASTGDPAANSPKRAKWLAEQERKAAPRTRRELLGGTGEER